MDGFRRETRYHSKLLSDLEMDALHAIMPNDLQTAMLNIIKQFQSSKTTEQEKEQLFANCQDLLLKAKSMDAKLKAELNALSKTRDLTTSVLMSNRMLDRLARIQTEEPPFEALFPIPKSDKPLLKPVHEHAVPKQDSPIPTKANLEVPMRSTPKASLEKKPTGPDSTLSKSIHSLQEDLAAPVQPKTKIDQSLDASSLPETHAVHQSASPKIRSKTDSERGQTIDDAVTVPDSPSIEDDGRLITDLKPENEPLIESKTSVEAAEDPSVPTDEDTNKSDRQSRIQDYISSDQNAGSTISIQEGDAYHEDSSDEDF